MTERPTGRGRAAPGRSCSSATTTRDRGRRPGPGLDVILARPAAPISLTSPDAPGVTRTYTDWRTITRDVINARVWEGVHYRTSDITGVEQGLQVARWELGRLASLGI